MPSLDIVTSQSSQSPFRNCFGVPTAQLLFHGRTPYKFTFGKDKTFGFAWKDQFHLPKIQIIIRGSIQKQYSPLIKAVATVELSCLVHGGDGRVHTSGLHFESASQMLLSSSKDTSELDDREKQRRMRISMANKGNVPWNKGRKHSSETVQRIRERTRLAMQDPKVKMKLVNIGHAQSEETRVKIGLGVREGWQRRREKLMVQETCCLEWQNVIAEASRKGYNGQEELQWDSYKVLDEELKKEWLESIEKRKTMPRPKGSKRAPKSLEQRRKISEAISAKWADPGYRERVCSALSKYHGVPVGTERKPRSRKTGETQSVERPRVKKKTIELDDAKFEAKIMKKSIPKRKKNVLMYKDPMASSKLEMIRKIRAQRNEMENKKREATERAKLLIAEAEKAAKALEVAALTSPLARASLLETRKLIAEATRSIESIERGEMVSQDCGNDISLNGDETTRNLPYSGPEAPIVGNMYPDERRINGNHQIPSSKRSNNFHLDKMTLQNAVDHTQPLSVTENTENSSEVIQDHLSPSLQVDTATEKLGGTVLHVESSNLKVEHENQSCKDDEKLEGQARKTESSTVSAAKTKRKKWVCGRLVEVEED